MWLKILLGPEFLPKA